MKKLILLIPSMCYAISNGTVIDSSNQLSKYVVSIQSTFSNGTKNCTGVIIGYNKILTASHCVYRDHVGHASRVMVYFGTNIGKGYSTYAVSVHSPKQRFQDVDLLLKGKTSDLTLADLAVLTIHDNIPNNYKMISIAGSVDPNSDVISLGFGGTNGSNNQDRLNYGITNIQNIYTNDIIDVRSNYTSNNLYTHICPQDSGGPDIQKIDGDYQLVGIHYGYISENKSPTCNTSETAKIKEMRFLSTDVTYYKNKAWIEYEITN